MSTLEEDPYGTAKSADQWKAVTMNGDRFGARLKELRERSGQTQQQLAGAAKMTREGIAQLETGRREPAWRTVLALCQALGVSCEEFTREPAERPPATPGRPRKATGAEATVEQPAAPKRPRGRPPKRPASATGRTPPATPAVPPAEALEEEQAAKSDRADRRPHDAFTLDAAAEARGRKSKE